MSDPIKKTSALHNALAEQRPIGIRLALLDGAHPLERNADGKNVWDVVLSTPSLIQSLGEPGTAANDLRSAVAQMAQTAHRNFDDTTTVFHQEKLAIQKQYENTGLIGMRFVRDCISLATQASRPEGLSMLQLHDALHLQQANQILERNLSKLVTGNEAEMPDPFVVVQVGAHGSASASASSPEFGNVEDRRQRTQPPGTEAPHRGTPKP